MHDVYPTPGERAVCVACGAPIVYKDPYWDHEGEHKPRHIAQPRAELTSDQLARHEAAIRALDARVAAQASALARLFATNEAQRAALVRLRADADLSPSARTAVEAALTEDIARPYRNLLTAARAWAAHIEPDGCPACAALLAAVAELDTQGG